MANPHPVMGVGEANVIVVVLVACPVVGLKFRYPWFCEEVNCAPNGVAAESHVEAPLGTLGLRLFVTMDADGKPAAPGIDSVEVHDGLAPVGVAKVA